MNSEVVLAYFGDRWFHSAGGDDKKFDLELLCNTLSDYGIRCDTKRIDKLRADDVRPVFYTSSENPDIRGWVFDHISAIRKSNIFPEYDLLLAHENKGYQGILAKIREIDQPKTYYFHDFDEIEFDKPMVAKNLDGAGSKGVRLVSKLSQMNFFKKKISANRWLRIIRKYFLLDDNSFANYYYKHKGHKRVILQNFIPNLSFDYKILIFHNRYYCLKRFVRKNDFRASGSGSFSSEKPPIEVLDFARSVFNRFKTPYMSLDLANSAEGTHLIEYQALNFGPLTLRLVDLCYEYNDGKWVANNAEHSVEKNYAYAIAGELGCLV